MYDKAIVLALPTCSKLSSDSDQEDQMWRRPLQTEGLFRGSVELQLPLQHRGSGALYRGENQQAPSSGRVCGGQSLGGRARPALSAAAGVSEGPQRLWRGVLWRHGLTARQEAQPVLISKAEEEGGVRERGAGPGDQDHPHQPQEQRWGQTYQMFLAHG